MWQDLMNSMPEYVKTAGLACSTLLMLTAGVLTGKALTR